MTTKWADSSNICVPRTNETIVCDYLADCFQRAVGISDYHLGVDDRKANPNKHAAYWIKRLVDGPEDPG